MIDSRKQFADLLRRVMTEVKAAFPIEGGPHRLTATNWRWTDYGDDVRDDLARHKQVKLRESSLVAKLLADLEVTDTKTGKTVDRRAGMTIARLPHITAKGGYIVEGKELQVVNQLRLRPGLYTRTTVDDNIETFVNTSAAGTYRVILERESSRFFFRVGVSARFALPSVLRCDGISDGAMRAAWGAKIYEASNDRVDDVREVRRLYAKLRPYGKAPAAPEAVRAEIAAFLASKPLDPEVNRITVQQPFEAVTGQALLAASVKCLQLSRGAVQPDDTESLAFKSIHSVEDFVPERIRQAVKGIQYAVASKLAREGKIASAFHPGLFSDPIAGFFSTSEFARFQDQSNPVEIVATNFLTTTMGEGGIGSTHAVTDAVRLVHPSHVGVLDPMQSPEGKKVGITGHLTLGARKVGNQLALPVINVRTGAHEVRTLQELDHKVLAFPDQYDCTGAKPKALVTEVKGRQHTTIGVFKPAAVDYVLLDQHYLFSPTTNMVPFLNNDDGNRVGMADRHIEQTVPLKDPDSPRVMARFGAKGYEEVFGKAFLPLSPIAGKVRKVTDESITVEAAGGAKHDVPIHRYYPLNSNTYLHDTPLVKPGDVVKKGQPLVENNFTRGGTLAMGKNLTVAYMPFRGLNFEDGMVISESAARKLTSIHKYEERLDRDARVQVGLQRLLAHYPDQAEKLGDRSRYDADGVVKPGAVMTHGELLIAAVREQQLHEDYDFARLHRALSHQWTDASIYWTGDPAGTVVDVVKTPRFIKVVLTTEEQAQVGDKLCFAPEHELLTRTGWKPVDEVTEFDQICTLNQQTQEIQYQYPTRVYRYDVVDEPMYDLRSQQVAMRVTMNHRLYVNRRGRVGYELLPAKSVLGTRVRFKKDGVWRGVTPALLLGFPTIPLMKLLGFYLAEGTRDREDWRIVFHQTKPEGRAWFKKVCAVLGLHYNEQPTRFAVHLKKLWLWLDKTGGLSWQKRIPSEVLSFGSDALAALWEGVLVGDGSVCKSGSELITTTSTVFRDQLQEVALKCGWSANCREQEADVPVGACRGTINGRALMKRHRVFTVRLVKAKNRPQLNHGHAKAQKGQTESVVRHTGSVYCVEVPNHVVYTQLDSKPHWSGNSHRAGGKGIVTHIVPDGEMYRNAKGEPIDLLFNPAGVPGRVNPGQLYEAAAGKLAKQRGSPYLVANFNRGGSTLDQVRAELKKAGMDEHGEETVTDPVSGRTFPRVLVGDTHFLKLKHAVSKKFSARDFGHGYTINEQPGRTEEGSAQRIGGLELFALLSGDAKHFVHDAFAIKGTRNDEYWRALQLGLPTPPPKTPFVAEKFNAFLLGAGVNLERRGTEIQARPLLDRDILAASNGAIRSPAVITANTLKPEKGGLFDPQITGGIGGHHWSHIELPEPVVNPLMTAAVRSVLQLTGKQVEGLLDGSQGVNDKGEVVANPDGKLPTGGVAIEDLLKRVVPARELAVVRAKLRATTSVARIDELNKRRRYLDALQAAGLAPADAYLNRVVAVVPPRFRAVYPLPDGSLNVSDPVHGYREVLMVANALRDMRTMGVDSAHYRQLRGDLQRSVSGLVGLTEPLTRGAHFKGFLSQVKGASNKDGFFQGRLMSRPQDLSARSTVVPDPTLGLDQIGIPEKMGLTVYKPFLVRRLVGLGHTPLEARELVEKGDPLAVKALQLEAAHRPVLMNRAPSLHKFNVLAFRPTIVSGEAVQVNPLIVGGYNMDFDGDTVGIHVPVTEAARHEALEKSLASKNLFSPANDRVVPQPSGETILGLYLATLPIGKPTAVPDVKAMVALYRTKKAKANDAFTIDGKTTCPGVELVRAALPKGLTFDAPMTKQVMSKVIEKAAREFPKQAVDVINTLKTLGNQFVTEIGFSVSLRDLAIDTPARDAVLAKARAATGKLGFDTANQQALKELSQQVHGDHANRFVVLSSGSGALGGKAGQVTRMLATPVAVTDHRGQTIPVQIRKSYAEGFDLGSYWATMPGVRKGLMDKGLSTADTGYLTKLLVNANIDNVVSEADCQTTDGILMKLTEPDVVGRVVADGPYKGQLLTADRVRKLAERKVAELKMRSPLKCRSHAGTCQRCFGLGQDGKFYPIGFHLGVLAAQTIGEPSTQLALRTFHSGGAIGGRTPQGFKRVNQIFTMPDNVQHRQILAMTSGKVTKIVKAPAGGWDVTVAGRAHYVPQELGLRVKVGTAVQAGQPLSEGGVLRPQDLLEATGRIEQVRDAVINELSDNFKSSGVNIKRRIFETVVRPMTDRTTVTNPGSSDQVFVGDVLSHNRIEALNKTLDRKIEAEPTLLGIVKIPHLGDDFIGRMQHERLFDTMRQAPALGLKADFGPKGHPVTQLALTNIREVGLPKAGVPSRAVHR